MTTPLPSQSNTPPRPTIPASPPTTPQETCTRDLRSASLPVLRATSQSHKHNRYQTVKRGDLGQEFLVPPTYLAYSYRTHHPFYWFPDLVSNPLEWETHTWTKRDLYMHAQPYPGPPRRGRACEDRWNALRKGKARGGLAGAVEEARVAALLNEEWLRSALPLEIEDEEPECYWDHTCSGNYPRPAQHGKEMPAISEDDLQGRRNEGAEALVDCAVRRWEEGRRREEDRVIARTWEMLGDWDGFSDDGWADD